jgi:hypothetical protein
MELRQWKQVYWPVDHMSNIDGFTRSHGPCNALTCKGLAMTYVMCPVLFPKYYACDFEPVYTWKAIVTAPVRNMHTFSEVIIRICYSVGRVVLTCWWESGGT